LCTGASVPSQEVGQIGGLLPARPRSALRRQLLLACFRPRIRSIDAAKEIAVSTEAYSSCVEDPTESGALGRNRASIGGGASGIEQVTSGVAHCSFSFSFRVHLTDLERVIPDSRSRPTWCSNSIRGRAIEMPVTCLLDHWSGPGFAGSVVIPALTDEPPPEIEATGHQRCVVALGKRTFAIGCSHSM
jgi:hypothetical protein